MSMIKIKKGNGFRLICTLKDNQGNVVAPESVFDIKTYIKNVFSGPKKSIEHEIKDNAIHVHITPSVASDSGKYRFIITGSYQGEAIDRNPLAFEIVSHVEQENPSGTCADIEINPVYMDVGFAIGGEPGGSGGGIPEAPTNGKQYGRQNASWTEIKGSEAPEWEDVQGKPEFHKVATSGDYNDLKGTPEIPSDYVTPDQLKAVEEKIPTDYVTQMQLQAVNEAIPTDYATEKDLNNVIELIPTDYVTALELSNVENKIPTDYATENYVQNYVSEAVGVYNKLLGDRLDGNA